MQEFQNIFSRPLFIIIFRTKILFSGPYSILTGHTKVESVAYQVLSFYSTWDICTTLQPTRIFNRILQACLMSNALTLIAVHIHTLAKHPLEGVIISKLELGICFFFANFIGGQVTQSLMMNTISLAKKKKETSFFLKLS